MSKQITDKISKPGFVIKLSNETVQKLNDAPVDVLTLEQKNKVKTPESQQDVVAVTDNNAKSSAISISSTSENEKIASRLLEEDEVEPPNPPDQNNAFDKVSSIEASTTAKDTSSEASWGDYATYITYEGDVATYTDPSTKVEYTWCDTTNAWTPKTSPSKPSVDESNDKVYSYENDTHIYTDSDGSKFFWDPEKKAWIPKVDDDFLAHYQMSYGFVDNATKEKPKAETSTKTLDQAVEKNTAESGPLKRKATDPPKWFDASEDNNTKVYVSNLPLDTTEEEFVDLMQKYGLVMRDPSNQKMKIKLYMDKENDCFKGDALCTYIKIESVELALNLLDGSDVKGNKVTVQRAHFQLKGEYNPALKPKKKKKKELEKIKRMQQKLFDWRPEKILGERSKHERVVIVKNLFEPTDFDKDVQLILDFQQDLREECGKCGEVRKVVLYDRHPEGVAQITMKEPEEADAAVLLINGRWFGKRKLTAEIWDGRTKYRIAETDADINKRLDKWGKFLEGEDKTTDQNTEIEKLPENAPANVVESVDIDKLMEEDIASVDKKVKISKSPENEQEGIAKSVVTEKLVEEHIATVNLKTEIKKIPDHEQSSIAESVDTERPVKEDIASV